MIAQHTSSNRIIARHVESLSNGWNRQRSGRVQFDVMLSNSTMPTKPKQHRPASVSHATPSRLRPTSTRRGYDRHWARRARRDRRRHPFCTDPFGLHEGLVRGEHVGHIVPLSQGGEAFEESNLQRLCARHHSTKTRKDQVGMARKGW